MREGGIPFLKSDLLCRPVEWQRKTKAAASGGRATPTTTLLKDARDLLLNEVSRFVDKASAVVFEMVLAVFKDGR